MKFVYASIIASTLLAIACTTTPETNRTQLNLVGDAQMNATGEQAYKEILAKSKVSQNAPLNSEIVAIGRRIASATNVNYEWEFSVISEDQVNAFCLPGGKVAVYTALIPVAKTNAGLAAVLGHEVAHAVLRHSAERLSQQLVLSGAASLATITFSNSRYKEAIAAAMGVGATYGFTLPFSRYHEAEADRVGLEYMAKAGYDPREAITLWERMGQLSDGRPPEILSTHPDPSNRAKDLSKHMDKAMALWNSSVKQPTILLLKPF
ncbi:MAG: M48 family metallopeptidase [Chitinophagaceae bacterium]|nr:M48 family metallopeptidase [Oligoflexus sp.]